MSGAAQLSPMGAALLARLRALPAANPGWSSDALLIAADWLMQDAIDLETGGMRAASDAARNFAGELRHAAEAARTLAPRFAPPAEGADAP